MFPAAHSLSLAFFFLPVQCCMVIQIFLLLKSALELEFQRIAVTFWLGFLANVCWSFLFEDSIVLTNLNYQLREDIITRTFLGNWNLEIRRIDVNMRAPICISQMSLFFLLPPHHHHPQELHLSYFTETQNNSLHEIYLLICKLKISNFALPTL